MKLPLMLALRNGRERVSVIQPNGSQRPVLGTQSPQEDNRRAMIAERLDLQTHRGRQVEAPATIDEPLPVRTQTILSYRLPREVRARINGEVTDATTASRKTQDNIGVRVELKLD
ncbi:MAG TPA: hypothetical protein VN028_02430 [Rhodocyclaceae bacterium]|nr:hypothetical protein [Rhodocyclaceae bacterium]